MTTTELPATSAVQTAPAVTASAPVAPATNGLSIATLVLAIAGIVTGFWFASAAAIVTGFMARTREPQARIMANWGLVLGIVGIAVLAPFAAFLPFWL